MENMLTKINWKKLSLKVLLGVLFTMTITTPLKIASNFSSCIDWIFSMICDNSLGICLKSYPDFLRLPAVDWIIRIIVIAVLMWMCWKPIFRWFKKIFFRIIWDDKISFLSISSQKNSVGVSEDIMIYSDIDYRVYQFVMSGKNQFRKPIDKVNGKIVSTKTNRSFPIWLNGIKPEETYGIPGKCDFSIAVIFPDSTPPRQGYTIEDFWRHFGEFDLFLEFDSKKYVRRFSEIEIKACIEKRCKEAQDSLNVKDKPRVKKREK